MFLDFTVRSFRDEKRYRFAMRLDRLAHVTRDLLDNLFLLADNPADLLVLLHQLVFTRAP